MNRKLPVNAPPEVKKNERSGWIKEIRKYQVITPLYGGGEETQKADTVTIVRATEVRGQLRFWWRATRGGEFNGDLAKMKEREDEIWGSSAEDNKPGPSGVSVRIVQCTKGNLKKEQKRGDKVLHISHPSADWSYVAFPLRESKGSVLEGVVFDLEIKYPDQFIHEIEAALWAWENFGGIGARTRRGFGALLCTNSPLATMENVEKNIQEGIEKHVSSGVFPAGVPHLSRTKNYRIIPKNNATSAWEFLFKKLKDFRQHRQPGKNNKPGRSPWPEPDSIRLILNSNGRFSYGVHKPAHLVLRKFPRAKFGLPINFEFPQKDDHDPKKTLLQGRSLSNNKYIDRLASPLIIRPITCKDGALGLAVILEWETVESDERYTPPGGLFLTSQDYGIFQVSSDIDSSEANHIDPIQNIKGKPQTDVLLAFLDFLK